MLNMRAQFQCKQESFDVWNCQITKVIELPEREFRYFIARPLDDQDFIQDNVNSMGAWDNHRHCLLVLGENHSDGVLVDSQGYNYARYTSYVPGARDSVERELMRTVEKLFADISPNDDGSTSIYFEDIEELTGTEVTDDSALLRIFNQVVKDYPGVADAMLVYDGLVVSPVSPSSLGQPNPNTVLLKHVLLLESSQQACLVHSTADITPIPVNYLTDLPDNELYAYSDLLTAPVATIQKGANGTEIVIQDVDPQLLLGLEQATHTMNQELVEPTMEL